MINQKLQFALLFIICCTALSGCTENPFFNPPEVGAAQISGQVLLSREVDNSGVYVWIERLELSASTNPDGEFLINIPPPASQGGGNGIDGDLFMYFYIANYKLDSVRVSFLRGVPVISRGDLNEEGNLDHVINLSKLLNVRVSVSSDSVSMASPDSLKVTIKLTSTAVNPVASIMAKANSREYTPASPALFIKKVGSDEHIFKMIDIGYHVELVNFIDQNVTVIHEMTIKFTDGELLTGVYEVIPYVKVRGVDPPLELLESLGNHVLDYHPDYLNLPFKLSTENFVLTE